MPPTVARVRTSSMARDVLVAWAKRTIPKTPPKFGTPLPRVTELSEGIPETIVFRMYLGYDRVAIP